MYALIGIFQSIDTDTATDFNFFLVYHGGFVGQTHQKLLVVGYFHIIYKDGTLIFVLVHESNIYVFAFKLFQFYDVGSPFSC